MTSFLRKTVPAAFLAGGLLLGGAGAASAATAEGVLGLRSQSVAPQAQAVTSGFLGQVSGLLSGGSRSLALGTGAASREDA